MEAAVAALIAELTTITARNTVGMVRDKIRAAEAAGNDQAVIAAQSEIINELIADKNDLVRLGEALREQFVAQQITPEQLEWLSGKVVPLLEKWTVADEADDEARAKAEQGLEYVKQILDPELLQLAQVLGFNYKYAIGEALSELVHRAIVARRTEQSPTPFPTFPTSLFPGYPEGEQAHRDLFGGHQ